LDDRGFNWEYLEEVWHIQGTGPVSKLDDGEGKTLNYKLRILAPVYWNRQVVTFQARDITDKHIAKYMACPPTREIISHKHILYGIQEDWGPRGICVEGIFDAWRLGTNAFATFGIKFTRDQIRAMVKYFEEVVILYDPDQQAQEQADQLIDELEIRGVKAWKIGLDSDPGAMSQDDANHLLKELLT
jgi:DNA primase